MVNTVTKVGRTFREFGGKVDECINLTPTACRLAAQSKGHRALDCGANKVGGNDARCLSTHVCVVRACVWVRGATNTNTNTGEDVSLGIVPAPRTRRYYTPMTDSPTSDRKSFVVAARGSVFGAAVAGFEAVSWYFNTSKTIDADSVTKALADTKVTTVVVIGQCLAKTAFSMLAEMCSAAGKDVVNLLLVKDGLGAGPPPPGVQSMCLEASTRREEEHVMDTVPLNWARFKSTYEVLLRYTHVWRNHRQRPSQAHVFSK